MIILYSCLDNKRNYFAINERTKSFQEKKGNNKNFPDTLTTIQCIAKQTKPFIQKKTTELKQKLL